MIQNVTDNIVRIFFDGFHSCNAYLIKDRRILIDTGSLSVMKGLKRSLPLAPEDISMVLFTHMHYDHVGAFSLFPDSHFYASEDAIAALHDDPHRSVLDIETVKEIYEKGFDPKPFPQEQLKDFGLTFYDTPGHAEGSVCIFYEAEDRKILFSGDLFFDTRMDVVGRTDLATSDEAKMKVSLRKMSALRYDILCPGHGKIWKNG
ncbi:MAG: MBL fold metallo-hydrolase [Candidatus Woesearchaeota archaeon]